MTMDEIRDLIRQYGAAEALCGGATTSPSAEPYRAALLRAVEGIVRERDRAEAALVARHGGEPLALLAELDEAREALKAAEAERDALRDGDISRAASAERLVTEWMAEANRLLAERDAANGTAQGIAERLTAAESALAALSTETGVKSRACDADGCPNPASQVVQVAPGCEYHLCGQCYGQTPDGQKDPTKSKEDPHHG